MLVNLNDILIPAKKGGYAVGLFNAVNVEMARAVIETAEELNAPVIVGTAEVLLPAMNLERVAEYLIPMAKKAKVPVCVHYDHGLTFEKCMEALQLGFSSVMYDRSTTAYEENVRDVAETSVFLAENRNGVLHTAAVITMKNCRFEVQKNVIRAILRSDPGIRACADRTGMGMAVCEELQEEFPEQFRGLNFASEKFSIALGLKAAFEKNRLRLPADCLELLSDLAGIHKTASASGRMYFTESRNPHLPESHCDLAWSCALAVAAVPREEEHCSVFTDLIDINRNTERI